MHQYVQYAYLNGKMIDAIFGLQISPQVSTKVSLKLSSHLKSYRLNIELSQSNCQSRIN